MRAAPLSGYALFSGVLSAAGLPIYINAPKFYVDAFGVSIGALGALLLGLRLLDVAQDPVLGWLATRLERARGLAVAGAVGLMAGAMIALFAIRPPVAPLLWFALTLTALFTAFSFLSITFYAQGVARAARIEEAGHVRVATWREAGGLLGVSVAAVAPTAFLVVTDAPFTYFAFAFAGMAVIAALAMRREWALPIDPAPSGLRQILSDRPARWLLLVALVNTAPVAVTSTLFLFFVDNRLGAPDWSGPLLLLFFLASAGSVPAWGKAARTWGAKPTLLAGMALSIIAFIFAATLGEGDVVPFAIICVASGAALGADTTLLPAIFASRMARIAPNAGQAFGLWSFVSKFTLALAAGTVLPLLKLAGFTGGADNPQSALVMLSVLYALVPCALKIAAIALLAAMPLRREEMG